MDRDIKPGDFRWFTVEEISAPRGYVVEVIRDSWWGQREDGKVAIYRKHFPQCNSSEEIARHVAARQGVPGVVFVPLALWGYRKRA